MPSLATKDGAAVDVTPAADVIERQFNAAMNDDGPDRQAPPKRPPATAPDSDAPKPRRQAGRGRRTRPARRRSPRPR